MRLLQLISSSGLYGAETMLINLAASLERAGHRSIVGVFHNSHSPNIEIADEARSHGLSVEMIPCRGQVDGQAVRAIRQCIAAQDIDLVHTHGYKADVYGWLAARRLGKPLVATCHNWPHLTPLSRFYAVLDRLVLRQFHSVAAVSDAVADVLRRSGVRPDRIVRIDNGADLCKFAAASPTLSREISKPAKAIVGAVGRLSPEKGFDHLLRAAQRVLTFFPETLFVLVGEGYQRERLEELARELGIADQVIFVGQRTDMPGIYASLDIFVLSSLNEGMPMVILEALGAGRPVVATRVGAIPRLIPEESIGLLVPPGDAAELGRAITHLLADPELRRRMGQNGQAWVRQHFSSEAMAASYLNLYEALVGKPAATVQGAPASPASETAHALTRGRG